MAGPGDRGAGASECRHRHVPLYRRAGARWPQACGRRWRRWARPIPSCPMRCWAPRSVLPRRVSVRPSRLRRQTLDEVGGFAAFADQLADDYEMGRAVRASKGYTLAIPAMGVGHTAAEDSAASLFRHELRWSRTIRMVNPAGPCGQFHHPWLCLCALMSAVFLDFNTVSLAVLALTLGARLFLKARIDGHFRHLCRPLLAGAAARPFEFRGVRGFAVRRNRALARKPLCGRAFGRDVPGLKT